MAFLCPQGLGTHLKYVSVFNVSGSLNTTRVARLLKSEDNCRYYYIIAIFATEEDIISLTLPNPETAGQAGQGV